MLTPNAFTVRATVLSATSDVLGMTGAPFKYTSVRPVAEMVTAKCTHVLSEKLTLKDGVVLGVVPEYTVTNASLDRPVPGLRYSAFESPALPKLKMRVEGPACAALK